MMATLTLLYGLGVSLGATPTVVAPFRWGVLFEHSIGRPLCLLLFFSGQKLVVSIYPEAAI